MPQEKAERGVGPVEPGDPRRVLTVDAHDRAVDEPWPAP